MKDFKDFGIKPIQQGLIGDKIKMERILNKEITVFDYRIVDSKFEKGNGKCLHLQIGVGDNKHVLFTGSTVLQETIERVPKSEFPFKATIVKENDRYEFT